MRRLALTAATLAAVALAGCSPGLPKGADRDKLDEGISNVVGDPNTCVLLGAKGGGKALYRYNSHTTCDRKLPACDHPGLQTVDDLLKATAKDGQPRTLSCNTAADGSRGVGWASGVTPKTGTVYAAVMEGNRAFPGRMIAERLADVFTDAGL